MWPSSGPPGEPTYEPGLNRCLNWRMNQRLNRRLSHWLNRLSILMAFNWWKSFGSLLEVFRCMLANQTPLCHAILVLFAAFHFLPEFNQWTQPMNSTNEFNQWIQPMNFNVRLSETKSTERMKWLNKVITWTVIQKLLPKWLSKMITSKIAVWQTTKIT